MLSEDLFYIINTLGLGPAKLSGSNIRCKCPRFEDLHNIASPSSGSSMSMKIDSNEPSVFFCFVCNFKGTVTWLCRESGVFSKEEIARIEAADSMDFSSVIERRMGGLTKLVQKKRGLQLHGPSARSSDLFVQQESVWISFDTTYHEYAESRGISKEAWDALDLRFDPRRNRVCQAIRRFDGKLVSITGRATDNSISPRHYIYTSGPKAWVYREDVIKDSAVLVEGPFKAARLYSKGIKNIISLLGARPTQDQINFLLTLEELTICLDNDEPGIKATDIIIKNLYGKVKMFVVDLGSEKELEELEQEKINSIISDRIPVISKCLSDTLTVKRIGK